MSEVKKLSFFFFFNDTATTEIYTLSLHDALPISAVKYIVQSIPAIAARHNASLQEFGLRSEEHTSELQSQSNLVCRLLLEKKKTTDEAPSCFRAVDVLSCLEYHNDMPLGVVDGS